VRVSESERKREKEREEGWREGERKGERESKRERKRNKEREKEGGMEGGRERERDLYHHQHGRHASPPTEAWSCEDPVLDGPAGEARAPRVGIGSTVFGR